MGNSLLRMATGLPASLQGFSEEATAQAALDFYGQYLNTGMPVGKAIALTWDRLESEGYNLSKHTHTPTKQPNQLLRPARPAETPALFSPEELKYSAKQASNYNKAWIKPDGSFVGVTSYHCSEAVDICEENGWEPESATSPERAYEVALLKRGWIRAGFKPEHSYFEVGKMTQPTLETIQQVEQEEPGGKITIEDDRHTVWELDSAELLGLNRVKDLHHYRSNGFLVMAEEEPEEEMDWQEYLSDKEFDITPNEVQDLVTKNNLTYEWKLNRHILILDDDFYLLFNAKEKELTWIKDIKEWVEGLSDYELSDYVPPEDEIYHDPLGCSLKEFREHPSSVYHYTTQEGWEGVQEEGQLNPGGGTGLTNRWAHGVFTSIDPEEYADGTYGDVCLEIDLPTMLRENPNLPLSLEPEVEEALMKSYLYGALELENNTECNDTSANTLIIGAAVPIKYIQAFKE